MDWGTVGTLVSTFSAVGGFTLVSTLVQRRRNRAQTAHQEATTDSLTTTTMLSVLAPMEKRAEKAETDRDAALKRISRYKGALRAVRRYLNDVLDDVAAGRTPRPIPTELETELDELEE